MVFYAMIMIAVTLRRQFARNVHARVLVCVCVRERERVCVCVCVCPFLYVYDTTVHMDERMCTGVFLGARFTYTHAGVCVCVCVCAICVCVCVREYICRYVGM